MKLRTRRGRLAVAVAAVSMTLAGAIGAAHADILHNDVQSSAGAKTLTITSGGSASVSYYIDASGQGSMPGCDASDGSPVTVTPVTPTGVTATPASLTFTDCGTAQTKSVVFSSSTPSTGYSITHTTQDSRGSYNTQPAAFTLKVNAPVVTNTAPKVAVTGVQDGQSYTVSQVQQPGCSVTDEDSNASATPEISDGPYNALGSHSVSCSYKDAGGLTGSATATYTVVRDPDTTAPEISRTLTPGSADGENGWYKGNVSLDWTVTEAESPETLQVTGCEDTSINQDQKATEYTCSATSEGGSAGPVTVTIGRDATAPEVSLVGGPTEGSSYYFGQVPTAATCTASDATSGLSGSCDVSGYSGSVGTHTVTASVKDNAGNPASVSRTYTVLPWDTKGFYAPVDLGPVINTVKGGSTVPLKFEVFAGQEITETSAVKSFTQTKVACDSGAVLDEIETLATTGGTSLRYDATAGQFVQNWQTPKQAGACYLATVTLQDDSKISASFKLK